MKNSTYHIKQETDFNEMRLVARILQLLAILTGFLYLRVFVANSLSAEIVADQKTIAVLAFIFLIGAILGLIATWRWERAGALATLLCGLCLAVVTSRMTAENHWFTAFFYSSPFVIAGGFSLISWRISQNNAT